MDIDIDFDSSFDPRKIMREAIAASQVRNGELVKHACGHYFQTMPIDEHTGLAAIPYEEAEALGFFKIDFLHLNGIFEHFESKDEIRKLIKHAPKWSILQDESQVEKLFQLKKHAELLKRIKPQSVEELADCIALIRPGKKYMIDKYAASTDRKSLRKELYSKVDQPYYKKSHAISYALTIVLQMHLIAAGVL